MADALHNGADAVLQLVNALGEQSQRDYDAAFMGADADHDPHDYPTMVEMVRLSIETNLGNPDPQHRDGYLQALTDTLLHLSMRVSPLLESWDPVAEMAPAFAARAVAAGVRC